MVVPVLMLAPALAPEPVAGQAPAEAAVARWVTAPDGNEARYRVREQLARIEFPSDAVGATTNVEGAIAVAADGRIVTAESGFTVDLTSLATDSERRDNYVRRRTLETEEFPTATLTPRELRGATWPLPTGESTFELLADLTLHGVTRPTVWQVTARVENGEIAGSARTSFTFDEFGMRIPRVAAVLSVTDEIRLEYDFRLVPAPQP